MNLFVTSAKELMRHLFIKTGAVALFDKLRPQSAVKGKIFSLYSRRERFSAIYDQALWTHRSQNVPGSGQGSSLAATSALRSDLPAMLRMLGVQRLVDLGCGDFTWMQTLALPCDYVGVDVVQSIIEHNIANFADEKHSFECLDVADEMLPDGDAILCREVLFHLSLADVWSVLRNCAKNPRRYVLLTTDSSTLFNADIRSGDFRRLNLCRPPFSFPPPDYQIDDDAVEKGRTISIWKWDNLPIRAG